ncbi:MAG TPA: hypothetical protein VFW47_10325 [Phenylobacterium sp.]|nr:hypothetical protein [Phenylobacterium sp.]
MNRLRALLFGLMALLFVASGVARAAPAPGAVPPCHAMADMTSQRHTPADKAPRPDMLAMNCCLGCLPSQAQATPVAVRTPTPARLAFVVRAPLRDGLALAPELGPPRAGLN